MRDILNKFNNVNLNNVKVYRCIDTPIFRERNEIEFFSLNKDYASHFGDNCFEFLIDIKNSKILDLSKYNKLYKEKTGENGNLYNRIQGIFVIGEENISTSYSDALTKFSKALPEFVEEFSNEFKNCDAIYGEDAGYPNEFVYAVKNKSIITKI